MKYLKSVVTLQHDEAKFTNCGMCVTVCPHRVFAEVNGKVGITDRDLCMECGACAMNCPFEAIDVEKGVGCAAAILMGLLTGSEPTCC